MPRQTKPDTANAATGMDPIFISVKDAARLLNVTPWTVYQRLDQGLMESRYEGKRRLVRYASVLAYADSLPTERPEAS